MIVHDLGTISYSEAYIMQEQLVHAVRDGGEETLLLLEHQPVYTIGSGGSLANILDPTIQAVRVNRGGDVTFHGPGQLVGYPIIDLSRRGRDLHRYLRFLEALLKGVVESLGVGGFTIPGYTGLWTERGKLASIGVGVRNWITMHGFALNVSRDVAPFTRINPCGMSGCRVTSLDLERGGHLPLDAVKELFTPRFEQLLEERLPHRER
ncbi:lipoyl(octanoyl) transferase LipB [Geomonas sp. RF6]|uniref:lipoyl(octanoyl) transferase LipB n=1 Tax=Geomonas sp. RF6 TaxID=2897342 RepID=UPI001E43494C|nr:lipoyl(octanoyl) transferase LipB [Geomonas sp. RF6]UFS71502.1 lipoyl(octanoyl) transferase LipB [Geomonas sp. RF6]